MTKVKLPHVGWAYIVLVLDWHSKKIVGHSIALRSKTKDWLGALHLPCKQQFPLGSRSYSTVSLVFDNGCQPTPERYMKVAANLGIKQIFSSFNNPKGNADTERMMRTMKEELIGSNEFESFTQLSVVLDIRFKDYKKKLTFCAYLPVKIAIVATGKTAKISMNATGNLPTYLI